MNRKDYRKLMNIKKRNKNYAKFTILASLGLGVALVNSTTTHAEESREWKANTSTTIKSGDTEYKILWGDTLSLISRDSGLTMDTLATLNNILNQDLIYEGNIIVFGNGATATVKDSEGNVIAEAPLTQADQSGIKEAQKNNTTSNSNNTNVNNGTTNKNTSTTTNTNNGVVNTVKPVKPTGNGNNGSNTGGTTNPVKPIDPVKPVEKEYVITISHTTEDGEVLSKETRKAKANTTVEAKAIDFSDRGYKLIGESIQKVNVKEDTTITFKYKKTDTTKPEIEKVDVTVKHLGNDGKVLSTETIKAEKGSTVKADAKDFTDMGYVLNDEISKTIRATEGATIQFNYRNVDTPKEDKLLATRTYFDVDTEDYIFTDTLEVTLKDGKAVVKAETIPSGYKLAEDETGVHEVSKAQSTASFKVEKIDKEEPVDPANEDKFVTINLDISGNDLGQNVDITKFEKISQKTEKSVETLDNGNTVTTHTTTITWKAKDVYVPKHTSETIVINVDTEGNILTNTDGYTWISEGSGTDDGVTTTAENGDTHTVYTETNVWIKEGTNPYMGTTAEVIRGEYNGTFYEEIGNSGMVWADQRTASLWALTEIANSGNGGSYWTWQVRVKETNQIMWTVDLVPK